MSPRSLLWVLTSMVCLTMSLSARLGDTERECFNRYSSARPLPPGRMKPEDLIEGATHLTYHFQGWQIRVAFLDGRVAAEEYRKLPTNTPSESKITDSELAAILDAEKGTHTWQRHISAPSGLNFMRTVTDVLGTFGEKKWTRSDGAFAWLKPAGYYLCFVSREAIEDSKKKTQAAEEAKKKNVPKF